MDSTMILEHLAMAERHVAQGEATLAKQRALIEHLRHDGHDTTKPLELLRQFEEVQAMHVADRDRLLDELSSKRTSF